MKTRYIVVCALVAAIALLVADGACASERAYNDVIIGWTEDPVIDDGGQGGMRFKMVNVGNETLRFSLAFAPEDAASLDGHLKRTLVTVPPMEEEHVALEVTVRGGVAVEDAGRFTVSIHWGRDLELGEGAVPVPETVEGSWERTFGLREDEGPTLGAGPLAITAAVVVVALIIIMYPAWRDRLSSRRG